jgi:TRAP-type C4-dicarboxylate transport system permease small subunit
MKPILRLFAAIDQIISFVIKPIVVIISLAVAFMLTLGIFTRTALDAPMFGLEELVLMGAMWLYMLGAVLASRERTHLSADFVQVVSSNPKVINFMRLFATVISLIMAVMFVTWSYDLMLWGVRKGQTTTVFQLPWYISQGSLFVASILLVFYLSRDLLNDFIQFMTPASNLKDK